MSDQIAQDVDPETGWSRLMVERMVKSIHIANAISSWVWTTTIYQGRPILDIGNINFVSGGKNGAMYLLVDQEALEPEAVEMFEAFRTAGDLHSNPSFSWVDLPLDSTADTLAVFADAHEAAIRKEAKKWKINQRWKWYQDEARHRISQVAGKPIPEPGYMEQLMELRSKETSSPPSATNWNQSLIEQMVRSIRAAHSVSPSSWALIESSGQLVLNVRANNVIWATPAISNNFAIDASVLSEDELSSKNAIRSPFQPGSVPEVEFLRLREEDLIETVERFRDAHESAVSKLAQQAKLANQWMEHREDLRIQLESMIGEPIPSPGYVKLPLAPDTLGVIRSHFRGEGLHYTDAQIATFYTALQTKGFVVLSGISGTGKSKIAQHFVELLPDKPLPVSDLAMGSTTLIPIEVTPTTLKYALVNFPRARIEQFPVSLDDPKQRLTVEFEGVSHDCAFVINTDRNSVLYRLFFSGPLRPKIVGLPLGTVMYFLPVLDDEQAVLTGFRITLDPAFELEQADVDETSVEASRGNHLFLSVRPDWRDSTSLLGYFNPLTGHYQWTDFLRFILRAAEDYKHGDRLAWFVILDEMNLAHVEYYFADLLSVIESGRRDDPADPLVGFTREPLRTSYPESGEEDEVPPREIYLPPSLYIIGTVNMDETTHAFSPKVLDRAFTIELTEVDFTNFPPTSVVGNSAIDDVGKPAMLAAFTRNGRFAQIDKNDVAAAVSVHPEIRRHLQSLNTLLKRNRFHFGYRIFNEIAQYLFNNDQHQMMTFPEAFDQAVFMKVLPKFTGSRSRLRTPLLSLLAWSIDPALPLTKETTAEFDTHMAATSEALQKRVHAASLPGVAARALQMLETLETDGFVSFG